MSLHKFAEQVASQGRGDDSLLVHMTPDEVRNLQQFAQANGTTLTINPTTGLPEAGLLSDLFKAVAPIALGAFLGPAGVAFGGPGLSAAMAGVATGGITALATGSLSRGLMAGLGAYGGAGLGQGLMEAGNTQLASTMSEGAQAAAGAGDPTAGMNAVTREQALSAGAKAATASPGAAFNFAKNNLGNLAYAAAPIMAGAMVPTTTKMPDPKDTGYIRQMAYNINPDTGMPDPLYGRREMAPVKASEWKDKTFQGQRDLFYQQNPNPYELGVGSLNQPPQQQPARMDTGGIVALADGGVPGYATGGYKPTDAEVFGYFSRIDPTALKAGKLDADIARDMQTFGVSAADIARITGTQNQQADYEKRFVQGINAPTLTDTTPATAAEFLTATKDVGLTGTNLNTALQNSGLSAAGQYASQNTLNDAAGIATAPKAAQDFYTNMGYTAGALPGDQGGLAGLYANINYSAKGLQDQINAGKLTVDQAQALARGEMGRVGVNDKDIKNATGKDFASLFTPKTATQVVDTGLLPTVVTPPPNPFTSVVPGGTQMPGATTYANGAFGNYGNNTGNPLTSTPGDIITNPDGTRTVVSNIPGRPYGGFPGMEAVRNSYTAGGGSLGYTAPIPKDPATYYNKMTDDSLDAYNFLMGKGKNLTQRKAETRDRPVMQRYDEAVLGRKMGKPVATTATTKKVIGVPGNPQSYFNEAEYLAANPDVAAELKTGKSASGQPTRFTSGYEHYLMYGKAGGRPFTGDYEGYLTAATLANAANAGGGGDGPTGPSGGGNPNSISGFTPAPPNDSIPDTSMSPTSTTSNDAPVGEFAMGGATGYALGGGLGSLGSYSDGGRLLKGPGDGVSDSIPATIGTKNQPARLADGEFVIPARIVSELGNGSTDAGAKKLYAMMDRVQRARGKTTGKNKVAANSRADKYLPA